MILGMQPFRLGGARIISRGGGVPYWQRWNSVWYV